ncbi:MAG: LacI family DNA-binding transcriptional regulator [Desulfobacterales bacterium]|nr:LacI family DNA-binding transcriptional regulator [Desulfobacterales bacterium]
MTRKPTIKDVARAAQVSTATVSRVLEQAPSVRPQTRERVLKAVAAVDYSPNVIARNLRRQETRSIFLVVRDMHNPFYLEVFQGVEAEARALGYNVFMGNTEDSAQRGREYFQMLKTRYADGMILMTGKLPPDQKEIIQAAHPPVVVASEYFPELVLPTVRIDNVAAAAAAVRHLIELGHRRIAHITGPTPEVLSTDRHQGYLQALGEAGITADPRLTVRGNFTIDSGHRACRTLAALGPMPTAVFCSNDEMAMGAINELRRLGLSVPEDISVVGFDDIVFAGAFHPPLTTIHQPRQAMGKAAMRLLGDLLAGRPVSSEPIMMPTELIVRGSTAPPAQGGQTTPKEV